MTIAYVVWRDAVQEAADDNPGRDFSDSPLVTLEEVGWLANETEEAISLSMEYEPDSQTFGRWRLHIPRVNIISLRTMDVEKFPKRQRKVL